MAINMEERLAQLDSLNCFIENSREKFTSILNILGWDVDTLREQSREMVICPLNSEHYVPKDSLEKHVASCSWKMEGYHEQDVPLPEGCGADESKILIDKETRTAIFREAAMQDPNMKTGFCHEVNENCALLGYYRYMPHDNPEDHSSLLMKGIPAVGLDDRPFPKTMDRIISDFTPDERRMLYDFVVSKTRAGPLVKVEELQMPFQKEEKKRPKSFIERLAEERDAKRRKVSKKVHTNRKSHTEILREVIQNQMELYEDFLKQESEELRRNSDRKHREKHDYDLQLKDGTSSVTHALKKSSSPCKERSHKERSRKDKREFRRHEHSRSHRRTETEPARRYSRYLIG